MVIYGESAWFAKVKIITWIDMNIKVVNNKLFVYKAKNITIYWRRFEWKYN